MTVLVGEYGDNAQLDAAGALLRSTAITVKTMAGATATLYADITGAATTGNPVNTDSDGNLIFFAPPAQYELWAAGVQYAVVSVDWPGISIGVIGGPAGPLDGAGLLPASQTRPVVAGLDIFNVKAAPYNAAGNGTTDDTTAIAGALTDAHAAGGTVYLPPGTYKTTATLNVTKVNVNIAGPGSSLATIAPTNNGDCIRIQMASFVAEQSAGRFSGFTIDGAGAGASASGLHIGEAMSGALIDVRVKNFTGGSAKGIWFDNRTAYTERWLWEQVNVVNNTIGTLFDVNGSSSNSFGYHVLNRLHVVVNSGQVGVRLQNGSLLYNGQIGISGNIAAGGTFMQIAGITNVGTTAIANGSYNIQAELTGGGSGSGIVLFEYGLIDGTGAVDCSSGTLTSATGVTHPGTFNLSGWINLPGAVGFVRFSGLTSNTASAGGIAIPTASGFLVAVINGTVVKFPYCPA